MKVKCVNCEYWDPALTYFGEPTGQGGCRFSVARNRKGNKVRECDTYLEAGPEPEGPLGGLAALEHMTWQFAHRGVKGGKSVLHTGGLSALEEAFHVLGWEDPHYVEDTDGVICDVEGCAEFTTNQGCNWKDQGYWCLCSEHGFEKTPMPKMKQRAINRESRRNPVTRTLR